MVPVYSVFTRQVKPGSGLFSFQYIHYQKLTRKELEKFKSGDKFSAEAIGV
jgi:hypothetical protein